MSLLVRIPIEEVDLAELTSSLQQRFERAAPRGYLDGRTALRDAVADELECSELEAEDIVDTLVARGFVRYEGDPCAFMQEALPWRFG
jgi:hypothetical protein